VPQPPTTPVQARELVRSVPFCAQKTYAALVLNPLGGAGDSVSVEWDIAQGITDAGQLLTGAFPGAVAGAPHATGPYLDAAVYSTATVAGSAALLTVEYAIDRGCAYRLVTPGTAVPDLTFVNISGLRITGRFVRVTLENQDAVAGHTITVEFGVYVRSS
jgi:hypothetical protein